MARCRFCCCCCCCCSSRTVAIIIAVLIIVVDLYKSFTCWRIVLSGDTVDDVVGDHYVEPTFITYLGGTFVTNGTIYLLYVITAFAALIGLCFAWPWLMRFVCLLYGLSISFLLGLSSAWLYAYLAADKQLNSSIQSTLDWFLEEYDRDALSAKNEVQEDVILRIVTVIVVIILQAWCILVFITAEHDDIVKQRKKRQKISKFYRQQKHFSSPVENATDIEYRPVSKYGNGIRLVQPASLIDEEKNIGFEQPLKTRGYVVIKALDVEDDGEITTSTSRSSATSNNTTQTDSLERPATSMSVTSWTSGRQKHSVFPV